MELKDIIKRLRGCETQAAFGEHFGVAQTTVGRWERGAAPKKDELLALAKYAGMPVEEFVSGFSREPPNQPDVSAGRTDDIKRDEMGLTQKGAGDENVRSALDFAVAQELFKQGISDPERQAEAVRNLHKIYSRWKPR